MVHKAAGLRMQSALRIAKSELLGLENQNLIRVLIWRISLQYRCAGAETRKWEVLANQHTHKGSLSKIVVSFRFHGRDILGTPKPQE